MEDIASDAAKTALPLAAAAAKPLIQKAMEKMLKRANGIDQNIIDAFKVEGREMTILCPESIQKYSLSIVAKETSFFNKKARFELGKARRTTIRSVTGLQSIDAVTMIDNGFELNLKKLKPGGLYVLDVEYSLEDPNFLETLVNREVVNETPESDSTKYWMVAQLKHLESLKSQYGRIDLRDVDFNVNVGVHQDINTKIPNGFKEQIETLAQLTKRKGRGEKFNLFQKLLQIQNTKYGGKELELLSNVMELFTSTSFSKFVNVTTDFHYSNCEKGAGMYDYPFVMWPKFMKVTSRTDLGLNKPASNGMLVYKRGEFMSELERIFDKHVKA
ncbi:hypothetical protein QVH35_00840 [Candidatus Nitrosotenuis chungbukensis]|uniref:hypothetical protein n=1 Tax=Candidatus Nitrosotenuis chungbukensis TaxID=1353246 RepID=UPI002673B39A|nr:hypothetical protein [Candidatus Nitrosotenuis chungbukensis]WKT58110.1 hypothetical protein QVH35_00840 [Candidatus Nitrosotenuis chungbukensis]